MEQILLKFAEHGDLALMLAVTAFAMWKLFLRYEAAQEARHEDAKNAAEKLYSAFEIVESMKNERQELLELLRNALREASSHHQGSR